jgi:hypothetical protein
VGRDRRRGLTALRSDLLVLAALVAVPALAGCTETPDDCSDDEAWNAHEERCAVAVDPSPEVCHAWLSGSVDDGHGGLVCQARSDGKAWLDVEITTSEPFPVEVRDASGLVVFSRSLQFPGSFELSGAPGGWTLSVDYDGVAGSGSVVLWG